MFRRELSTTRIETLQSPTTTCLITYDQAIARSLILVQRSTSGVQVILASVWSSLCASLIRRLPRKRMIAMKSVTRSLITLTTGVLFNIQIAFRLACFGRGLTRFPSNFVPFLRRFRHYIRAAGGVVSSGESEPALGQGLLHGMVRFHYCQKVRLGVKVGRRARRRQINATAYGEGEQEDKRRLQKGLQ